MSKDKNLPGASFRFASVSSSGSHTNEFGVGEMSLGIYRPGLHWPQVDLGEIWYSEPTPEQYDKAATCYSRHDKDGRNYVDINRRLSRKQAEYITYLITDMLTEKLKGEVPTDDEIDEIMKQVREGNYPVNRTKREQEKKYQLTAEQNVLLGKLREEAYRKHIVFSIEFEDGGRSGYIRFTRPGANMSFGFGGSATFCDAVKNSIYQLEKLPTIRWPAEQTNASQPVQKPVFPPNRIESEDHRQLGNLIETTKKRCEENEAERVLAVNKTLTDYKNQTK